MFSGSSWVLGAVWRSQKNSKGLCGCGLARVAGSQPAGSALVTLALICSVTWQVTVGVLSTGASKGTQRNLPSALQNHAVRAERPCVHSPWWGRWRRWRPLGRSQCIQLHLRWAKLQQIELRNTPWCGGFAYVWTSVSVSLQSRPISLGGHWPWHLTISWQKPPAHWLLLTG